MQVISEFFVDPLVLPAYFFLATYGIVWAVAFGLARLFMNQIENRARNNTRLAYCACDTLYSLEQVLLSGYANSR